MFWWNFTGTAPAEARMEDMTSNLKLDGTTICQPWQLDGTGHAALGGIMCQLDKDPAMFRKQMKVLHDQKVIRLGLNSLVLEFMVYNGNTQMVMSNAWIFEVDASGNVRP